MTDDIALSVIIPAYKEEQNISGTLEEVEKYLGSRDLSAEVIVIDDGSDDDTLIKAREFEGRLPNYTVIESSPNRGKGYVLRRAVMKARGEWIMFMDADSSVSIREMDKFIPFFDKEFDICIASRRVPGANVDMPFKREFMGRIYIAMSRLLLGLPVNDINCGFKMFRRDTAKDVFSRQIMNDWSFDAEVLHLANKRGRRIKEIPVDWVYRDTSKVNPLKDGIKSFISLVRIKTNDISGKYAGYGESNRK